MPDLALGAVGAVVNLGKFHLGPQTALQTMMICGLLAILLGGTRALARREVGWALRLERGVAPYTSALGSWVRSAPMTVLYVATWSVTSVIQQGTPAYIQDVVDRFNSTNLTLLAHNPVRVLFSSAFIVSDRAWGFVGYLLVYATIAAAIERALGWRRTLIIWAASHVLGSLATAVTEALLIRYDVLPSAVGFASDVGVSYVMVGACGAYLLLAGRWGRWLVGAGLAIGVVVPLVVDRTVWELGHAYATVIGIAAGWTVMRGIEVHRRPRWSELVSSARADQR